MRLIYVHSIADEMACSLI